MLQPQFEDLIPKVDDPLLMKLCDFLGVILRPGAMQALTASITAALRVRNAREAHLGGAVREVVRLRGELKVLHPIIMGINCPHFADLYPEHLFPGLRGAGY